MITYYIDGPAATTDPEDLAPMTERELKALSFLELEHMTSEQLARLDTPRTTPWEIDEDFYNLVDGLGGFGDPFDELMSIQDWEQLLLTS